jgi:hypothetical protein
MKITVSVCRKVGMPNYGSEGASCEITVDVAEKTVSTDPPHWSTSAAEGSRSATRS